MKFQKPALPNIKEIPRITFIIIGLSIVVLSIYGSVDQGINGWKDDLISGRFANIDRAVANQLPVDAIADQDTREIARLYRQSFLQDDFRTLSKFQNKIAAKCDGDLVPNSTYEIWTSVWKCSGESLDYYYHVQHSVPNANKTSSKAFDRYIALYQMPLQRNTSIKYYVGAVSFVVFFLIMIFGLISDFVKGKKRENKFQRVERTLARVREYKPHYRVSAVDDISPESLRRAVDLKLLEVEEEAEALEVADLLEQQARVK